MYLIDVPNLKEIELREGYFYVVQKFFKSGVKKKKCEENWAIFESVYHIHYSSDFFQI